MSRQADLNTITHLSIDESLLATAWVNLLLLPQNLYFLFPKLSYENLLFSSALLLLLDLNHLSSSVFYFLPYTH